jgi:hypothetical protein
LAVFSGSCQRAAAVSLTSPIRPAVPRFSLAK